MPVPPVTVSVIDPLLALEHVAAVAVPLMLMADGDVTVNDPVAVQPAASVAVTEYVPAARLLILAVVAPLLQR